MTDGTSQRVTTWTDLWIVVAALVTVIIITLIVISAYRDAADAATLLAVIFPSAVAVATAAFGVTQAVKADKAEKQKDSAEQQTKAVTDKAGRAFSLLQEVDLDKTYSVLERLGSSPAGETRLTLQAADGGKAEPLDLDDIVSQRANFQQAKALLAEIARPPD